MSSEKRTVGPPSVTVKLASLRALQFVPARDRAMIRVEAFRMSGDA
jgi:hypothetical protein